MTLLVQMQDAGTPANASLLSYAVTTTPSPLKASPENPQAPEEIGELVISVARQSGTPAHVERIRVKVPAGTMAPDLATDLARISKRISLDGWNIELDAATKEFVCTPTSSPALIGPDTGFTIQLSDIPVNRKVGTAPITVTERSRTGSSAFQDRPTIFNIGKFPADFYLRNFLCEPSIIPNGGDVRLTWERSANATYSLLYPGVDRDVTDRTTLELEGITADTTFYLRATTGDPTNPVTRILSAQVTVLKPDLEVGNLTVHGRVIGDLRADKIHGQMYPEPESRLFVRKNTITTTAGYEKVAPTAGFLVGHNTSTGTAQGTLVLEIIGTDGTRRAEIAPRQCGTLVVTAGETIRITVIGSVSHTTSWYSIGRVAFG
ncbi:hypothetical protein [Streptomyces lydicus]|uniref:hypothetical protein n=1 Tax=Streptomyces lydicus TaxID=47763 RepID=UPI003718BABD